MLEIHLGIAEEFRQRWASYTKNLLLIGLERPKNETADVLSDLRRGIETILKRVDDLLQRRVWETCEHCFEIVMDVGYGILLHQAVKRGMRSRNPPVLIFDTFVEAIRFLERMLKSRMAGILDLDYREDLRTLLDKDPSRYTCFLAYSLLFAAEGIWHVAAALAERVMEIAHHADLARISGREAAYMRAVALRHGARRLEDLTEVARLIDEAERRLSSSLRSTDETWVSTALLTRKGSSHTAGRILRMETGVTPVLLRHQEFLDGLASVALAFLGVPNFSICHFFGEGEVQLEQLLAVHGLLQRESIVLGEDVAPHRADGGPVPRGLLPVFIRRGQAGRRNPLVTIDAPFLREELRRIAAIADHAFPIVLLVHPAGGRDDDLMPAFEHVVIFANGKFPAG